MPDKHAVLSPSASGRWLSCLASVRLSAEVGVDEPSRYAEEGTDAHTVAESQARRDLLSGDPAERALVDAEMRAKHDDETVNEMDGHAGDYTAFLSERLGRYQPGCSLHLEQRLYTGIPGCWGTSDAVIVAPLDGVLEIIDFKYGAGVAVSAEDNSQLKLYALGALDTFSVLHEFERVVMTIHQPRAYRGDLPHEYTMTVTDLLAWREEIRPLADRALNDPHAPFTPSEASCRWCPAAGRCLAQSEYLLGVARDEFSEPISDALTPERMGEILQHATAIQEWLDAVSSRAFDLAYEGETIPGFKVVRRGGARFIRDTGGLWVALRHEGYSEDDFTKPTQLRSLKDMERLVGGRAEFDRISEPYISHRESRLSLAPGSPDDDDAVTSASELRNEFGELES